MSGVARELKIRNQKEVVNTASFFICFFIFIWYKRGNFLTKEAKSGMIKGYCSKGDNLWQE
jgi:hypothetical protein